MCVLCVCVWVVCRILVDLSFAARCTSKRNWKKLTEQNERIETTTFWPAANTFRIGICVAELSISFPPPRRSPCCSHCVEHERDIQIYENMEKIFISFSHHHKLYICWMNDAMPYHIFCTLIDICSMPLFLYIYSISWLFFVVFTLSKNMKWYYFAFRFRILTVTASIWHTHTGSFHTHSSYCTTPVVCGIGRHNPGIYPVYANMMQQRILIDDEQWCHFPWRWNQNEYVSLANGWLTVI